MSSPPSVQHSPDGRWWWDGSQWRPVPGQVPQPQAVTGQLYQPGGPPPAAMPLARTGVPTALIVVLAVLAVLLLVGGLGLVVALRSAADRLSGTANPPVPAISLPASSGASLALPPIRGVTVTQVTTVLQAKGYRCTVTRHVADTWLTSCSLTDNQHGTFAAVSLGGSDSTSVGLISAGLIPTRGAPPTSAQASELFTTVVGAVGPANVASQADSWIRPNLDAGGDSTVGNLHLHLARPGSDYLLVISAAG